MPSNPNTTATTKKYTVGKIIGYLYSLFRYLDFSYLHRTEICKIYCYECNFFTDRIIDDMNSENKLTRRQLENLLDFEVRSFLLDFYT